MELSNAIKTQAKSAQISAKVFDIHGNLKEDLGVVSYWHRNPLKRWAWAIKQAFKSITKKLRS